jgi:hypothetical protein
LEEKNMPTTPRNSQDTNKLFQKTMDELKKKTKPLEELVQTEEFYVKSVLLQNYQSTFTPVSEMVFGGSSPTYSGGHSQITLLEVIPRNDDIPVENLTFKGMSTACAGDWIITKIPRIGDTISYFLGCNSAKQYTDRKYNKSEKAIEIIIKKGNNSEILRTERSADYENYQKK